MADWVTVPPPAAGLYPQAPPPPQGGVLGNAGGLLDLAGKVQNLQQQQISIADTRNKIALQYLGTLSPTATDEDIAHAVADGLRAGGNPEMLQEVKDRLTGLTGAARQREIGVLAGRALTPEQYQQPSEVISPTTGEKIQIPFGLRPIYGLDATAPASTAPPGAAGAPAAPGTAGSWPPPPPPSDTGRRGAGLVSGLPSGTAEEFKASSDQAANLLAGNQRNINLRGNLNLLKNISRQMQDESARFGGPLAETEANANKVIQELGFQGWLKPEMLARVDEFNKISAILSAEVSKGLVGSNAGLEHSTHMTPNLAMSIGGREAVIDNLLGGLDFEDAVRREWMKAREAGWQPAQYNKWLEHAKQRLDPNMFIFNRLAPAAQRRFIDSLPPQEQDEFRRRYPLAVSQGWVEAPKPFTGP